MFGGEDGVRVCHVMGDSRNTLATALGQITTPPQEAILVAPQWVAPDQVSLTWRTHDSHHGITSVHRTARHGLWG